MATNAIPFLSLGQRYYLWPRDKKNCHRIYYRLNSCDLKDSRGVLALFKGQPTCGFDNLEAQRMFEFSECFLL